jgi:hypothetical protein
VKAGKSHRGSIAAVVAVAERDAARDEPTPCFVAQSSQPLPAVERLAVAKQRRIPKLIDRETC